MQERILELLEAQRNGDDRARAALFELLYDDLRRLAARSMQRERPDHTLAPTSLVHEVFLRLRDTTWPCRDGREFFSLVATVMRHLLVDSARRRLRRGQALRELEAQDPEEPPGSRWALDLESRLIELGQIAPELTAVVELRFLVGLDVEQTAQLLEISKATVKRRWRTARAWLQRSLSEGSNHGS